MYPVHGGRFSGEPAYFRHVLSAAKMMMDDRGTTPADYTYVVLHQPNGKFPTRAAKQLGFTDEQLAPGLLTPVIGNTYSGAVPLGLAHVLDQAKPGDRILVVSYGSGAGSDAFDITVTDAIKTFQRDNAPILDKLLAKVEYVDYAVYAKFKDTIKMPEE